MTNAEEIVATWQKMGTVDKTAVPYYLMLIAAQLADHTELNRQVLELWKTIRDAQNERKVADQPAPAPVPPEEHPASAEPKGDVAAEECKDLLLDFTVEKFPLSAAQFITYANTRIYEAFHRGESTAFTRIRETAAWVASRHSPCAPDETDSAYVQRVLDETARRLGIKP